MDEEGLGGERGERGESLTVKKVEPTEPTDIECRDGFVPPGLLLNNRCEGTAIVGVGLGNSDQLYFRSYIGTKPRLTIRHHGVKSLAAGNPKKNQKKPC